MKKINYGRDVGAKFDKNGKVINFSGNTVICSILPTDNIFNTIKSVKEKTYNLIDVSKYAFLPESSYHMTVIEGVCDQVRIKEKWSKYFDLGASIVEIDDFFIKQFRKINIPDYFNVEYAGFEIGPVIIIKLRPKGEKELFKIKNFRDEISDKFGIKFPDYDNYLFHMTLAYNIIIDNDKDKINDIINKIDCYLEIEFKDFKTNKPELSFFENMFRFNKKRGQNE